MGGELRAAFDQLTPAPGFKRVCRRCGKAKKGGALVRADVSQMFKSITRRMVRGSISRLLKRVEKRWDCRAV